MLLPRLAALLLTATCVSAFSNTSPFLLLSSNPLPKDAPLWDTQLALSTDVEDGLVETLRDCDQQFYYVLSQQHVTSNDFSASTMPKIQKQIAGAQSRQTVAIPEVSMNADFSAESIVKRLRTACDKKHKKQVESWPQNANEYRIMSMDLPKLPADQDQRAEVVKDTDDALEDIVASVLGKENPSALIYITTPPSQETQSEQNSYLYEMDEPYPSALHTDLKRDLSAYRRQSDNNEDMQAGLPLFEKYQFLSPALFMSLSVSLLLLIILYVGVSAIAGLEVSYAAFSKEMGQSQKGKQQ